MYWISALPYANGVVPAHQEIIPRTCVRPSLTGAVLPFWASPSRPIQALPRRLAPSRRRPAPASFPSTGACLHWAVRLHVLPAHSAPRLPRCSLSLCLSRRLHHPPPTTPTTPWRLAPSPLARSRLARPPTTTVRLAHHVLLARYELLARYYSPAIRTTRPLSPVLAPSAVAMMTRLRTNRLPLPLLCRWCEA